jgi:large subunit ribosomal protein L24
MRIRRGDMVEVIAGDDYSLAHAKGQLPLTGRVLTILPKKGKVVVEGINRVYKHVRRSQKNPQGGRLSKEMPIDLSNVMLLCQRCNRGVRVATRVMNDGGKERYCKKCSQSLGQIAPARERQAKASN